MILSSRHNLHCKDDYDKNHHSTADFRPFGPFLVLLATAATADDNEVNGHKDEETDDDHYRDTYPNYDCLRWKGEERK